MSDSYSRAQTRESVESTKKWLEYESVEYESRLDPSLQITNMVDTVEAGGGGDAAIAELA